LTPSSQSSTSYEL